MDRCCDNKAVELTRRMDRQGHVLYAVFAANSAMFLVEFVSGWLARSTALLGDSLDMLGDACVYGLTLYTLRRSLRSQAGASLLKGVVMLVFGFTVMAEAVHKTLWGAPVPSVALMGGIGLLALAANALCFLLLYSHRDDNLNMRSTWICSRNDVIANVSVIGAAAAVAWTESYWPDLLVGVAIAALFIGSARRILIESVRAIV
ncbi:MAG TPA: cation transporter [Terriglobia bacterium]|nr:cation transporter [Terriglobia bacterium]